jgi:2-oxo-3-hexenedioate decarboxylase/2-keto-4-pentenoate hydratase
LAATCGHFVERPDRLGVGVAYAGLYLVLGFMMPLAMNDIRRAAEIIAAARRDRTPLEPLPEDTAPATEAEGYLVQNIVHELLAADFGIRGGYKVGCTSAVMQHYLGIPHPCGGGVFANAMHDSGVSLRAKDFLRVGVECEIAVRMARDLGPTGSPFTAEMVIQAIDSYLPAIEIVDDRYADWQTLGAPTLVADDFFAAGCVLGKPVARRAAPDLRDVIGRALINGIQTGQGTGADVLGHPHDALTWLANHLADQGKGLRAGEIVLTGSLVKTVWLEAGDEVVMELEGLGGVAVSFA